MLCLKPSCVMALSVCGPLFVVHFINAHRAVFYCQMLLFEFLYVSIMHIYVLNAILLESNCLMFELFKAVSTEI